MESPLMMRLHPCHFSPHGIIRSILRCGFLENAAIRRKAMKQKTDNLIRGTYTPENNKLPLPPLLRCNALLHGGVHGNWPVNDWPQVTISGHYDPNQDIYRTKRQCTQNRL